MARSALIALGIWASFQLLWRASTLVFVALLGVLLGVGTAAIVDRLEARGVRRGVGSGLVVASLLGAIVLVGVLLAPTLSTQGQQLRRDLPDALERAQTFVNQREFRFLDVFLRPPEGESPESPSGSDVARLDHQKAASRAEQAPANDRVSSKASTAAASTHAAAASAPRDTGARSNRSSRLLRRIGTGIAGSSQQIFGFVTGTLAVVSAVALIALLAVYIGAEPLLYRDLLLGLMPEGYRAEATSLLRDIAEVLRSWLATQFLAMLIVGVITTASLALFGVNSAIALGVIAGLMEFIPTLGPIIAAVPAIAVALVESPQQAATVAILYIVLQFVENNFIIPYLMRAKVDLPPALTLVAQALMGVLFGFMGLMVAVPITAALLVPLRRNIPPSSEASAA